MAEPTPSLQELETQLRTLLREHYECEDCYYSCPLSAEGDCNDNHASGKCYCGAEEHNKRVEALRSSLSLLLERLRQTEADFAQASTNAATNATLLNDALGRLREVTDELDQARAISERKITEWAKYFYDQKEGL